MRFLLVLGALIVTATAYKADHSPPCKEDEVHKDCGSACHPTCETFEDNVRICTLQCVAGCYCKDGTYRAESGQCVPGNVCKLGQGQSEWGDHDDDEDDDTWP
ncbi:hypothetical protein BDW74DRAFT_179588 [Aspergillus multicolor]|uniref:trypsin inhibitor-like cysteine-rich domain-containing protein n=1 Tax=Aspergillus multicolor TaxID=41759 RepID=UPI003CCDAF8C